jgi:NADH-quinone oxidoreductase subunit J
VLLVGVINARQTTYSLVYLLCIFTVGACIIIGKGASFIGLLFIIVYVGAIGMFFLFMIMLIDKNDISHSDKYTVIEALVILLIGIYCVDLENIQNICSLFDNSNIYELDIFDNLSYLAFVLYEINSVQVVLTAFLLFIAMIVSVNNARKYTE